MACRLFFLVMCVSLHLVCGYAQQVSWPRPPQQPRQGPGGAQYPHASLVHFKYGHGNQQYWIFEPRQPRPSQAPLVIFNHGWAAMEPRLYGAWIEHIVRRGHIVIFPRYQASIFTPPRLFTTNALKAWQHALQRLQGPEHVTPQAQTLAIVGHSMGGVISANLAALAPQHGLAPPRVVMCVQPGKTNIRIRRMAIPLADLSRIPASTLLVCVTGDQDHLCGEVDARKILACATRVAARHKYLLMLASDDHGRPALVADHLAPLGTPNCPGRFLLRLARRHSLNALDYYGLWKTFDCLCNAAQNQRPYVVDTWMGYWSDGVAVKPLVVRDWRHP